ncbi:hypothetical protein ACLK18_05095 [Escherichia coli]
MFCLPALRPTWSLCSVTANVAKSILSVRPRHNYLFEAGGAAVLGSIQPQPIDAAADGTLPLDKVAMQKIKLTISISPAPNYSVWKAPHNGKVLPREYRKKHGNLPASAIWRCMLTVRASLMPWWLTAAN